MYRNGFFLSPPDDFCFTFTRRDFFIPHGLLNFVKKNDMERFLKIVTGNVKCVNREGNLVRSYWTKGGCIRVDWYSEKEETVQLQLSNGKLVIVNKNGSVIKTI
jgi:hypothetical protein